MEQSKATQRQAERRARLTVGQLGEELVAAWVRAQGGMILEQRWHCRRGELDLVALKGKLGANSPKPPCIVFIEVKTRSQGNWDEGGLMALTPNKQQKIWHSARLYLAKHPRYAHLPCRFDLALVQSRSAKPKLAKPRRLKPRLAKPKLAESARSKKAAPLGAAQQGEPQPDEPKLNSKDSKLQADEPALHPVLGQAVRQGDYWMTLQHYLVNAFQLD